MTVKIFVGNLAPGTHRLELIELFKRHGDVVKCDVVGSGGVYGFVHMENEEIARKAIKALDAATLNGYRLNIQLSTPTTQGRTWLASRLPAAPGAAPPLRSAATRVDAEAAAPPRHPLTSATRAYPDAAAAPPPIRSAATRVDAEAAAPPHHPLTSATRAYPDAPAPPPIRSATRADTAPPLRHACACSACAAAGYWRGPCIPAPPPLASLLASSSTAGGLAVDSFARELLALYHWDRALFEQFANDPLIRSALDLPPV